MDASLAKIPPAIAPLSSFGSSKYKNSTGRWTSEEHQLFLQGLKAHGRSWKRIAQLVKTRTLVQVRTHAQKYLQKKVKLGSEEPPMLPAKTHLNVPKKYLDSFSKNKTQKAFTKQRTYDILSEAIQPDAAKRKTNKAGSELCESTCSAPSIVSERKNEGRKSSKKRGVESSEPQVKTGYSGRLEPCGSDSATLAKSFAKSSFSSQALTAQSSRLEDSRQRELLEGYYSSECRTGQAKRNEGSSTRITNTGIGIPSEYFMKKRQRKLHPCPNSKRKQDCGAYIRKERKKLKSSCPQLQKLPSTGFKMKAFSSTSTACSICRKFVCICAKSETSRNRTRGRDTKTGVQGLPNRTGPLGRDISMPSFCPMFKSPNRKEPCATSSQEPGDAGVKSGSTGDSGAETLSSPQSTHLAFRVEHEEVSTNLIAPMQQAPDLDALFLTDEEIFKLMMEGPSTKSSAEMRAFNSSASTSNRNDTLAKVIEPKTAHIDRISLIKKRQELTIDCQSFSSPRSSFVTEAPFCSLEGESSRRSDLNVEDLLRMPLSPVRNEDWGSWRSFSDIEMPASGLGDALPYPFEDSANRGFENDDLLEFLTDSDDMVHSSLTGSLDNTKGRLTPSEGSAVKRFVPPMSPPSHVTLKPRNTGYPKFATWSVKTEKFGWKDLQSTV